MKVDVSREIIFSTARSGGKGGQNVNKVETMVEGRWQVQDSEFFSAEQKQQITFKLAGRINSEGFLLVKSQASRSQLANKQDVIEKLNTLIAKALVKKKARISTKPGKAAKERRIKSKKINAEVKQGRKKINL